MFWYRGGMSNNGRLIRILSIACVMALGLMGCAEEPTGTEPETGIHPTATAEPESKPKPKPVEQSWDRFSHPSLDFTFELPPDWSAELAYEDPDYGVANFDLIDKTGAVQLQFAQRVMGLGGGCTDTPYLPITELDSEPFDLPGYAPEEEVHASITLTPPRFVYQVLELDSGVVGSLAVIDEQPEEYCFYYNLLHTDEGLMSFADTMHFGQDEPPRTFESMDEAEAYMQTDEYGMLKRVLLSLEMVR